MTSITRRDGAAWRKSGRSGGEDNCVEAATASRAVAVRDSKNPDSGQLRVGSTAWKAFAERVRQLS